MGAYPVPDGLRWDLYLGPVAEEIAYGAVHARADLFIRAAAAHIARHRVVDLGIGRLSTDGKRVWAGHASLTRQVAFVVVPIQIGRAHV